MHAKAIEALLRAFNEMDEEEGSAQKNIENSEINVVADSLGVPENENLNQSYESEDPELDPVNAEVEDMDTSHIEEFKKMFEPKQKKSFRSARMG